MKRGDRESNYPPPPSPVSPAVPLPEKRNFKKSSLIWVNGEEIFGTFCERKLQKTNQTEFFCMIIYLTFGLTKIYRYIK